MNTKATIWTVAILAVIAILVSSVILNKESAADAVGAGGDRMMSVEDYIRMNISEISPVKEQVGGTFYVTAIEAEDGSGTVEYEDGHNAYVADFEYSIDEGKGIDIESFEIRE
jgi:hypothetical protein